MGIQMVEQLDCVGQEGVVVVQRIARTAQQRFDPRCFRHRHTTDVKIVDQSPDSLECGISVQPEARQQDLEGHLCPDMRELSAVEVEPDCPLGILFRA